MAQNENSLQSRLLRLLINLPGSHYLWRPVAEHYFHQYFSAVAVTSDQLRDEVYRIRYDVYCDELRFEDPSRFPDKREIDSFDQYALHCLLHHKPSNTYAGCVRLVFVNPNAPTESLPFEHHCHNTLYRDVLSDLVTDRSKVAEISRLAVRASFRRRQGEQGVRIEPIEERTRVFGGLRRPWIGLGLYFAAAAMGLIKGLDGVFALMEPSLARRLKSYGINFVQVGDAIEHRGARAPFFISRRDLFTGVRGPIRGFLEVVQADLLETGAADLSAPSFTADSPRQHVLPASVAE